MVFPCDIPMLPLRYIDWQLPMQIFTASNIPLKIVDFSRNLKSLHVLDLNYSGLSCICSLTGCEELKQNPETGGSRDMDQ